MLFKILGFAGAGFICFCVFMVGGYMLHDGYNPVSPSISTKYAPQYEEVKFGQIEVGMDTTDVVKLIGMPFGRHGSSGIQAWYYTGKGKCKWNEFAWLKRFVVIDHRTGKVRSIQKSICYE